MAVLLASALLSGAVRADDFGGSSAVVTSCWLDSRYFQSFTSGVVDYCRGHIGYQPGRVDCYRFTDEVCSVFLPASHQWIETRHQGPSAIFPCPDAAEPPMCPRLGFR